MRFSRSSGILLPVSALPSPYGIGDLGPSAYKFVDWLRDAHQSLWQILPFSIADDFGCPYSSCSAYGGYPLLISPDRLVEDGLLAKSDLHDATDLFGKRVRYDLVQEYKRILFYKAWDNFKKKKIFGFEFASFVEDERRQWLRDLALFLVLSEQMGPRWWEWPEKFKNRDADALEKFRKNNEEQINFHKFLQFLFFRQWGALKSYANSSGIKLIGDIPIFLSHQSMDVWKDPHYFKLAGGEPYVVTGAPPDQFSAIGQKWGNPNYNWPEMEKNGFQWWINRVAFNLRHYDIIRLDHFRGFAATWEIPADNPDPRSGYWSPVPGHNLFHCLGEKLGDLPIIAEDLGKITPDVIWLRDRFGFPGMKILQFAFNEGDHSANLPHNWGTDNCVVYTGTHDNQTTKGWAEHAQVLEKHYAYRYSNAWNWENLNWSLAALAINSQALISLLPLQDVMGLGNEGRINVPGTQGSWNWSWRFRWEDIKQENIEHLRHLTRESHRNTFLK
jgi:4-alpha-glucanotransferase